MSSWKAINDPQEGSSKSVPGAADPEQMDVDRNRDEAEVSDGFEPADLEMDDIEEEEEGAEAELYAAARSSSPLSSGPSEEEEEEAAMAPLTTMSDNQIFDLPDISHLTHEMILQLLERHTNADIYTKWNSLHPNAPQADRLTSEKLTQRVHRAFRAVAKKRGIPRDELKKYIEEERESCGVAQRRTVTRPADFKSKPSGKKRKRHSAAGPETEEEAAARQQREHELEILQAEVDSLLTGDIKALLNDADALLKVAQVYFPAEICGQVNQHHGVGTLKKAHLASKMREAYEAAATARGITKAQVKVELDQKQRAFGTRARQNAHATEKRLAAVAAKKQKGADGQAVAAEMDSEEESEDEEWGPLDDLDALANQLESNGQPQTGPSNSSSRSAAIPPTELAVSPRAQAGRDEYARPAGFLVGTLRYVPGFRAYGQDGEELTGFESNNQQAQQADALVAEVQATSEGSSESAEGRTCLGGAESEAPGPP